MLFHALIATAASSCVKGSELPIAFTPLGTNIAFVVFTSTGDTKVILSKVEVNW